MKSQKPREIAARILQKHRVSRNYIENETDQAQTEAALSRENRGLIQELVFGVLRHERTLDWLIDRKTGGRAQKPFLQTILRLGLYQIFWLDRVPDYAAVNEMVGLAKRHGQSAQAGFVNALLRGYTRQRAATLDALQQLKDNEPGLGYSHPDWLCDRWEQRWGKEALKQLLEWNNGPPPVYARVNTLKTEAAVLTRLWDEEQVRAVPFHSDWVQEQLVFKLESYPALAGLHSFQQGYFYIQDPSTLLAVYELNPQPGESILDMCSAPGGKTTLAAQRMQNRGLIMAQDLFPQRLKMVEENCARLGVTCVDTLRPERIVFSELTRPFDRVLLDAPCSNTGVIRRRVDLRWRLRLEELDRLRQTQIDLLEQGCMQLKPGGTLIYSTCSLESEENEGVTREFVEQHPQMKLESQRSLLPFRDAVDGAYVARFRKE